MISESRMLFAYPEHQIEIEWNGSATYNVFFTGTSPGDGENVNCFTDYSAKTMEEAQAIADEWLEEELKEINQGE